MADDNALSIAFMTSRPADAARAIRGMDPGDAAGFLEAVPTRIVAGVLARLGDWAAAGLLTRMSAATGAGVLRNLPYADAAAALRLMPAEARADRLDELPSRLARDFRRSLAFPADTIGAHMTAAIVALRAEDTVADARAAIREAGPADAEIVFVVDGAKRLEGGVSAVSLLRYPEKTPLRDIIEFDIPALSARARVDTVGGLDAWDDYPLLPVLSRRQQVIGGLSRRTAGRLRAAEQEDESAGYPGMAADLLATLFATAADLVRLGGSVSGPATVSDDRRKS